MRATAEVGTTNVTWTVIATRGGASPSVVSASRATIKRLTTFSQEVLGIVETNADNRIKAVVVFDLDDFDAAIAELEARYLAGEAAAHCAHVVGHRGGLRRANRHELPATTPDWVISTTATRQRSGRVTLPAYIHAMWDLAPDIQIYVEAVHRLSNLGAVVTHAAHGTSQEGFEAEWRRDLILTFDGDLFSRCELFDEADLDAALARFEELQPRRHGWKTRQAKWPSASWRTSRQRLGRDHGNAGGRLFQ